MNAKDFVEKWYAPEYPATKEEEAEMFADLKALLDVETEACAKIVDEIADTTFSTALPIAAKQIRERING